MRKVLLGYEIGTGNAIEIPILHTAVTGQTQQSGKTTTLEALITRSGLRAVTFITKRAEGAFESERRIPAYFRERADWEFVSALLEATLRERMKFERSWIMRVCKGAKTLKDVQENVNFALREARRGLDENVYLTLSEYLAKVVPQIEQLPYSNKLELETGINAIDVADYSSEVQALVIRSVIEWIYERERNTIVLIPEAWEFLPQKRNSPVKLAAVELIRKGAAAGNFVWLDSQDIAGVDKEVLKQISVWILGVQREVNEVKRTLNHLPPTAEQPTVEDVMTLGRGEFYVSYGRELHPVYVQPAWLSCEKAKRYAMEELPASFVAKPKTKKRVHKTNGAVTETKPAVHKTNGATHEMEDGMPNGTSQLERLWKFLVENFHDEERPDETPIDTAIRLLGNLKALVDERSDSECTAEQIEWRRRLKDMGRVLAPVVKPDTATIVEEVIGRLSQRPEFIALKVSTEKPELNVTVQRKVIDVDGSTLRGRLAQLLAQGWFDEAKTGNAAFNELQRLGFGTAKPNVYRELDKLSEWGFVTKEPAGGYQAVAGMKVNVREVQVA